MSSQEKCDTEDRDAETCTDPSSSIDIVVLKKLSHQSKIDFMELCIKEVDNIIKNSGNVYFVGTSESSWKFPHMSILDVDVDRYLSSLRVGNKSPESRYINLAEVLIDRLFFGLMILNQYTIDFLRSMDFESRVLKCCSPELRDVGRGSTNIGNILSVFFAHLFALRSSFNKTLHSPCKAIEFVSVSKELSHKETPPLETSDLLLRAKEIIMFVGNTVRTFAEAINDFTPDTIDIDMVNEDIMSNQFNLWCKALESDCKHLLSHMNKIMEENSDLRSEILNLRNSLEQECFELKECKSKMEGLKFKLKRLKETKKSDIKIRTLAGENTTKQQSSIEEQMTNEKVKHLENANKDLRTNAERIYSDFGVLCLKLNEERHTNQLLRWHVQSLDNTIVEKSQIENALRNELKSQKRLQDEKFNSAVSDFNVKSKIEKEHKAKLLGIIEGKEQFIEKQKTEIVDLTNALKTSKKLVEDLQFSPDLLGPVKIAEDRGDIIPTFERQIEINLERINALQEMNERYANTIARLSSVQRKDSSGNGNSPDFIEKTMLVDSE